MRAVAAHSDDPDTGEAARELLAQLEEGLGDDRPAAAFVFANVGFDHEALLGALNARWPGVPLIGGSSDGEGSSVLGYCEDSACALMLVGDLEVGVGSASGDDRFAAGQQAAQAALEGIEGPPKVAFTVLEPLGASAAQAASGIASIFDPLQVPVVGAASGDDQAFEKTYQFVGGDVVSGHVVVMTLGGAIDVAHAVGSGFEPVGAAALVTRAEANVVHEVDGVPALEHYRATLGNLTLPSSQFPFAMRSDPETEEAPAMRTPLFGDEATGTITFAGDVPEGSALRFAHSDGRDGVVDAAAACIAACCARLPREPVAVLFFSCTGRKDVLGTRSEEECVLLRRALGDAAFAGFYGYGEVGPVGVGATALHNQTFVCVALAERP